MNDCLKIFCVSFAEQEVIVINNFSK